DARPALQPVEALAEAGEGDAEHAVLRLVPAGAEPEVEPAAGERVHGRRPAGEHRGVIERQRADERAEADAPRVRGEPAQRRPAVERGASRLAEEPGEVVRAKERLPAAVLRRARE